jgi:hypothetical protein
MITQAYYDKMFYFTTLRRFTHEDALEMQAAIQQTFNSTYTLCTHCPAQIEHGQLMIRNWLETQVIIESITPMVDTEEPLFDFKDPTTIVDIEEADRVGCSKCNKKRKNKG